MEAAWSAWTWDRKLQRPFQDARVQPAQVQREAEQQVEMTLDEAAPKR